MEIQLKPVAQSVSVAMSFQYFRGRRDARLYRYFYVSIFCNWRWFLADNPHQKVYYNLRQTLLQFAYTYKYNKMLQTLLKNA